MRRLPIFFVIDVSESMIGGPITEVGNGMRQMIQTLRQNPHALETAYISVIVFAGKAKTLTPLTDIVSFYPPQFPIGGGTSLGAALTHLTQEIETKVTKNDGTQKGDWKPVVFLFTDGVPTDNPEPAVREWTEKHRARTNLVAISMGNNSDVNLLKRLTDQVLIFNDSNPDSYQKFFQWITASISAQSQRVEDSGNDQFNVDMIDATVLMKADLTKHLNNRYDENHVVLPAKCQRTSALYLIKFKRNPGVDEWAEFIEEGYAGRTERPFSLAGAFAIPSEQDYAELSADAGQSMVNTGELAGNPSCPCCGNQFGFSTCACGGIHCSHGEGMNRCPWCFKEGFYGFGAGESDVSRGLG